MIIKFPPQVKKKDVEEGNFYELRSTLKKTLRCPRCGVTNPFCNFVFRKGQDPKCPECDLAVKNIITRKTKVHKIPDFVWTGEHSNFGNS